VELARVQINQPLIDNWLRELSPKSQENYRASMKRFAEFSGDGDLVKALARFLSLSRGDAFLAAKEYKAWLVERNCASTVNQRLSALRSFVSQCFEAGIIFAGRPRTPKV